MTNGKACLEHFTDYSMKFFPILVGFFAFACFGPQSIDCFAFPADNARPNQFNFRRNQNQTKNARVKKKMKQSGLVPVGIWGGSGVRLSVEQKTVKLEYACASGEIDGRLKVDDRGNFKANGVHIQMRPGPLRVDNAPERRPARYEGKISGKTMTLKVTLLENKEVIGDFELERGVTPRLRRCL